MFTPLVALLALAGPTVATEAQLKRSLEVIATPTFEGRLPLTPGIMKTTEYFAEGFKRIGLKPGGENGTYFHYFDISVGQRPTKNNFLSIVGKDGKQMSMSLNSDFRPLAGSAMRLTSGDLVFVGYGLADDDWNDYNGIDVTDKVVVAFRGVPEGRRNASNGAKARTAKEKGAKGILFVGPTADGRSDLTPYSRLQGITSSMDMVAGSISEKYFTTLTGMKFKEARAMKAPASKALPFSAKMVFETETNEGKDRNVIGILPGNDPKLKDEYIIIGGHHDHLGYGETGSRTGVDAVHTGADDNGSGSVGVLALAEYFAKTKGNRRTIIFQLYSAEELGLRGSDAWCKDHPDILAKTTAMLNMDMIGTVRRNNVYAYGTTSAMEWDALAKEIKVDGLNIVWKPNARGDSDQGSFVRRNVPVIFWHTGLTNDYHTETDTVDKVNFAGMVKVLEAVVATARIVDKQDKKLTFNPNVERGNRPEDRTVPPPAETKASA